MILKAILSRFIKGWIKAHKRLDQGAFKAASEIIKLCKINRPINQKAVLGRPPLKMGLPIR